MTKIEDASEPASAGECLAAAPLRDRAHQVHDPRWRCPEHRRALPLSSTGVRLPSRDDQFTTRIRAL